MKCAVAYILYFGIQPLNRPVDIGRWWCKKGISMSGPFLNKYVKVTEYSIIQIHNIKLATLISLTVTYTEPKRKLWIMVGGGGEGDGYPDLIGLTTKKSEKCVYFLSILRNLTRFMYIIFLFSLTFLQTCQIACRGRGGGGWRGAHLSKNYIKSMNIC